MGNDFVDRHSDALEVIVLILPVFVAPKVLVVAVNDSLLSLRDQRYCLSLFWHQNIVLLQLRQIQVLWSMGIDVLVLVVNQDLKNLLSVSNPIQQSYVDGKGVNLGLIKHVLPREEVFGLVELDEFQDEGLVVVSAHDILQSDLVVVNVLLSTILKPKEVPDSSIELLFDGLFHIYELKIRRSLGLEHCLNDRLLIVEHVKSQTGLSHELIVHQAEDRDCICQGVDLTLVPHQVEV